jgi:hypothetical protein
MAWWAVLQAGLYKSVTGRVGRRRAASPAAPRGTARQPTPSPPASSSGRTALRRPLGPPQPGQLRRQRPAALLQILQVSAAGRTAAQSCGRPDSATPSSGECTDQSHQASASSHRCGPRRRPSRAEGRSPRAGGSSGRSPVSPPSAGLPGFNHPPGRRARPAQSRIAVHRTPLASPVGLAGHGLGAAGDAEPQRPSPPPPTAVRRPGKSGSQADVVQGAGNGVSLEVVRGTFRAGAHTSGGSRLRCCGRRCGEGWCGQPATGRWPRRPPRSPDGARCRRR